MSEDKDMIETVDTHDLPPKPQPRSRSGWESIKFWRRPDARTIPEVDDSFLIAEDEALRERDRGIKAVLDEVMLSPQVGQEYYDSYYNYQTLKEEAEDLPLERWSEQEKRDWQHRHWNRSRYDHSVRRIPVEQDGKRATLEVEVYPVDLRIVLKKDKEWSYGHVRLKLPDDSEGLHELSYLRMQVGVPENGWFKGGAMKDAMLKTLNGSRDTTSEEKEKRKVDQTSLTKKEAIEEWEKWLPAIQPLVDQAKGVNPPAPSVNP